MTNLREWWSDKQHRRITLYCAAIAAIGIVTYVFGEVMR